MKLNYGYTCGTVMDKCCCTIRALSERRLTKKELSKELKCSLSTAHRYIEAVSLCFPVNSEPRKIESGHTVEAFKIDLR